MIGALEMMLEQVKIADTAEILDVEFNRHFDKVENDDTGELEILTTGSANYRIFIRTYSESKNEVAKI